MLVHEQLMSASPADVRPYTGVRVLDLTFWCGSYATRLFADLGAEVIRVEPPEGLPDRQALAAAGKCTDGRFEFVNASKRSVVVDFASPAGRVRFERLLRGAAMVFVERDGPMFDVIEDLRSINPTAVITAISPYGLGGPQTAAPASDLVLQSAGGITWMSGRIDDAPLSLPAGQAAMVASVYAATVSAIALADAEATGTGHFIDLSVQECIAHSLQNAIQVWDLEQRISIRGGEGTRDASEDIFPCRDGHVLLASPLSLGNSWRSLVNWISECGHEAAEELSRERWSSREWRLTREARQAFREAFCRFAREFSKDEMTREAIARRIVLGPVSRIADLLSDEQLVHRGFFGEIDIAGERRISFPGAPYRLSRPVWSVSPAPRLGETEWACS